MSGKKTASTDRKQHAMLKTLPQLKHRSTVLLSSGARAPGRYQKVMSSQAVIKSND